MDVDMRFLGSNLTKLSAMRNALLLTALASCVLVAGCGNKDEKVVGKWNGTLKLSDADKKNPAVASASAILNKSTAEFKKDHTFALNIGTAMEGNWSLSGTTVSLTPTKVAGMTIAQLKDKLAGSPNAAKVNEQLSKPLIMKMDADGKSLTLQNQSSASTSAMVFVRQDAKA